MTQYNRPYIGITGATSKREVSHLLKTFVKYGVGSSLYVPMLGFLVSYKCLEFDENPGDRRYPKMSYLAELLSESEWSAFTTIHYNTKTPSNLYDEVSKVMGKDSIYKRHLCDGLQINVAWPPKEEVAKIHDSFPDLSIILQLPKRATEGLTAEEIATRVNSDYPYAGYVLIDPSGGRGRSFDVDRSIEIYSALKKTGFNGEIGFAGGLGGSDTKGVLEEVLDGTFGAAFSIDAEGKLRDHRSEDPGDSDLNLAKADAYIKSASAILLRKV